MISEARQEDPSSNRATQWQRLGIALIWTAAVYLVSFLILVLCGHMETGLSGYTFTYSYNWQSNEWVEGYLVRFYHPAYSTLRALGFDLAYTSVHYGF